MAACSPDDEVGKTPAAGASAGMGGSGENEAGGGASPRGGSPDAGGSSNGAAAGTDAGDAGSGSTLSVRERFAQSLCHKLFTCAEARKDFIIDLLGDEASCVLFAERSLDIDPDKREQMRLVGTHGVTIDEAALATCLELSSSCVVDSNLQHESCRRAIPGPRAVGESCHSSAECNPDTYCRADDASATDTCAGTCAARKPAESECNSSEECASEGGYYRCDTGGSSPTGTCQTVTVEAVLAVGDACGTTAVATKAACTGDLWCTRGDSQCAELIARDEPCIDDHDVCERGYFCAGAEGSRTCQPVSLATEENASCDPAVLQLCDLNLGLTCIEGTCQKVGDGGTGTLCGVDSLNCSIGFYCDRESDTCQRRLAASSPCTADRQCESGTCDATSHCAADYCAVR
jgi:hypothetical protein